MIPIIFSPTATDFTTNGIGRLSDTIRCIGHEARNGVFELELEYPANGAHFESIVHSAIIVAKPSARRGLQAFSVVEITKPMNGRVTVKCEHISYRLGYIPVPPITAGNLTNALAYLKSYAAEACPFTLSADFTSESDFAVPLPSSIRSNLGGRRGSILDIYGGEWEWNNWNVVLHRNRGTDSGYTIRYGKNLMDLTQEESIMNTYTGIFPYWQSEEDMQMLDQKVVHASTASLYPFQRTLVKDFSQAFNGKPSQAQLLAYTEDYISRNNIGYPTVSLQISFVNLPDAEEYREILTGENIDLCDTVNVYFESLGISVKSKVVEIWWDVLNERYEKIEVGSNRSSLSATLEEEISVANAAVTKGEMDAKIGRATGVLNAGTRGHIILNQNIGGWANELLALNNDNIAAATRVLRINMNGIGFANAYAGPYFQSWTMDGHLSLGGVNNSYGVFHILDNNGVEIGRWDKDGIFANGGTFSGTITGTKIMGDGISTEDGEFFVHANDGEPVEMGFSGFYIEDEVMQTAWMGRATNPATGGSTAGINGSTGAAGFSAVYILLGNGAALNVGDLLIDYGNRISDLEAGGDEL